MNKLYIIGNGFDKYHDLPTSYQDFCNFVIENNIDVENDFEEYFQFIIDKDYLWSNFEEDLGSFDGKVFFENHNNIEVQDENFRPSFVFSLEDDIVQQTEELVEKIREAFGDWLVNINLESTFEKIKFDKNCIFLNFNYTLTLEKVYKIPTKHIFHIHGDIDNNSGSLIFGHNKTLQIELENYELGDSIFTNAEKSARFPFFNFKKPVNEIILENKNFFESLKFVEEIKIYGHSINEIDSPYFTEIVKNIKPNSKWKVSYYEETEKEKRLESLCKIGVKKENIDFFEMS